MGQLTVSITIGRNIGVNPMPETDWKNFQASVSVFFAETYVNAGYRGTWDGVSEDSWLFIGAIKDDITQTQLETELAALAVSYRQAAIGLLVNSRADSLVLAA